MFCAMRARTRLSAPHLAASLGTTTQVIELLEKGMLLGLPDPLEVHRIVTNYAAMLRMDPSPLLSRIRAQREAPIRNLMQPRRTIPPPPEAPPVGPPRRRSSAAARSTRPSSQPIEQPSATDHGVRQTRSGMLKFVRTGLLVLVPMLTIGGAWFAAANPTSAHRAARHLPAPISGMVESGIDLVVLGAAPLRNGLRLLDSADPRSRKSDKLQVKKKSE
jgi:hypothetical protein